uniref:Uncharacterized protein n=1 Tax=Rhizophora mucronata TaxID=61149 RepID=A0A2P2M4W2_RHIMU
MYIVWKVIECLLSNCVENAEVNGTDVQTTDGDLMAESDEMQTAKRCRITLSLKGGGHTGSLSRDVHLQFMIEMELFTFRSLPFVRCYVNQILS